MNCRPCNKWTHWVWQSRSCSYCGPERSCFHSGTQRGFLSSPSLRSLCLYSFSPLNRIKTVIKVFYTKSNISITSRGAIQMENGPMITQFKASWLHVQSWARFLYDSVSKWIPDYILSCCVHTCRCHLYLFLRNNGHECHQRGNKWIQEK